MSEDKFSIRKRIDSFKHALNGLIILLIDEHNARVHLVATIGIVAAGVFFEISKNEWISVVFAIGFVIVSEIFNSAIENVADFITKEKCYEIKRIKDLAAAAVLISAIVAVIIGLLVFLPKVSDLF